ncbi:MAG: DMT family transporter [Ruaniaceae bacterium]|nr:DMT family transporter [Ruaniaceae bacterium]
MKAIPTWAALVLALIVGSMMAIQSRVNGELANRLDDPFVGTALVFILAVLLILIALVAWRPGREGIARLAQARRSHTIPWWMLGGGLVGGMYVLSQSLVVTTLGVALFSVASVGGQTLGGAIMDRTRIVPGGPFVLTPARAIGAGLAILAVVVSQSASLNMDVPLWMLFLPIAVGLAQGWQQAVNARVRMEARSSFTTTLLNATTGLLLLVPAATIKLLTVGMPAEFPREWWLYTGGLLGAVFIGIAPIVVHATGALMFTLIAITGQLGTALLLDLLRADAQPLPVTTIASVVLAFLAVVVGSLRKRPPRLHR